MPMLQKVSLAVMKCPPQHVVIIGVVSLSKQMVKSEDSELVQKFIRMYYRLYKDLEKAGYKTDEQSFDQMYESFDQFLTEYPKRHPVFQETHKVDILRLLVTMTKKIVKTNAMVVLNVMGRKTKGSPLNEMIRSELAKVSQTTEEKENEETSKLRSELSRLVHRASNKETTKGGLLGIYQFKKKNPNFDLNVVMAGQSEYFRRYVEKHLEILAKKEAGKFKEHFMTKFMIFLIVGGNDSEEDEPVSDEHNATYYHDRLKTLKERLGIEAPLPESPLTPVQIAQDVSFTN